MNRMNKLIELIEKEKKERKKIEKILIKRKDKKVAIKPNSFNELAQLLKNYTIILYQMSRVLSNFSNKNSGILNNLLFLLEKFNNSSSFYRNYKHFVMAIIEGKIEPQFVAQNFAQFYIALTSTHFETKGLSFVANPYQATQIDKARPNTKYGKFSYIRKQGYEQNLGLTFDSESYDVVEYFKMITNDKCAFFTPNNKYSKNSLRFDVDDKTLNMDEMEILIRTAMDKLNINGEVEIVETTKGWQFAVYVPLFFVKTFYDKNDYVVEQIFVSDRKTTKAFKAYQKFNEKFVEILENLAVELFNVKLEIDKFAVEQEKVRIWRNAKAHNHRYFSVVENEKSTILEMIDLPKLEQKENFVNHFEAKKANEIELRNKMPNVYKFFKKHNFSMPKIKCGLIGKMSENTESFYLTKAIVHKFIIDYNHLENFDVLLLDLAEMIELDFRNIYQEEKSIENINVVIDYYLENFDVYLTAQKTARSRMFVKSAKALDNIRKNRNNLDEMKQKIEKSKNELEKFKNNDENKLSIRKMSEELKKIAFDLPKSTLYEYIKKENVDILVEMIEMLYRYVIILMNGSEKEQQKAIQLFEIIEQLQGAVNYVIAMMKFDLVENEKLRKFFYVEKRKE